MEIARLREEREGFGVRGLKGGERREEGREVEVRR